MPLPKVLAYRAYEKSRTIRENPPGHKAVSLPASPEAVGRHCLTLPHLAGGVNEERLASRGLAALPRTRRRCGRSFGHVGVLHQNARYGCNMLECLCACHVCRSVRVCWSVRVYVICHVCRQVGRYEVEDLHNAVDHLVSIA